MNFRELLRPLAVALAVGGALLAAPDSAQAQQRNVPILLCPFGCGSTEGDTILMNQMILAGHQVVLLPQETPGYMYNIREMAGQKHWKRDIFGTEDTIIQLAFRGGTPELKEFLPQPVKIKFKFLYGEAWWGQGKFFVTFDDKIKSVADLKGKRISLGLRGQSDWGVFSRLFLEHGYGITPKNSDIRHMTPAALTQQLIDGATDAAVSVFGTEPNQKEWLIGGPLRQLEATKRKLRYLGIPKNVVDKVNAKFGTTFLPMTLKAGTLPGQTEDLELAINRGYKAAHPDFEEETAYRIVKAVLAVGNKMKDLHFLWKIWSPDLMLHGLSPENTHPGAIRAYKEAGLWDAAMKKYASVAVTYPKD